MPAPQLERVAIVGVGLIGGSFALALKAAGACREVVGVGRDARNIRAALDLGVIDRAVPSAAEAARGADLVLVATPVAQFPALFAALAPVLAPHALLTDGGSTKRDVVAAARAALGAKLAQFVPAHPVAGAEKSGARAARADLMQNRRVVLTPLPENRPDTVARVAACWEACGATVSRMSPEEHDAVLAAVSHLPHVLAYALVDEIAGRADAERLFEHAAGGFRDFTRIASSHPEMWRDICVANRDAIVAEIDRYAARLAQLRALVDTGDAARLERLFERARASRDAWLAGGPLPPREE
jgi:prephenate dehydrogenase